MQAVYWSLCSCTPSIPGIPSLPGSPSAGKLHYNLKSLEPLNTEHQLNHVQIPRSPENQGRLTSGFSIVSGYAWRSFGTWRHICRLWGHLNTLSSNGISIFTHGIAGWGVTAVRRSETGIHWNEYDMFQRWYEVGKVSWILILEESVVKISPISLCVLTPTNSSSKNLEDKLKNSCKDFFVALKVENNESKSAHLLISHPLSSVGLAIEDSSSAEFK